MATHGDLPPERYVPIPYGFDDVFIEKGVLKFFEDPDFARLVLKEPGVFNMSWATDLSAVGLVKSLDSIIGQYGLDEGRVRLRRTSKKPGAITRGVNVLSGEAEDVIGEIEDNEERVAGYELIGEHFDIGWGRAWPKDFHDIPTNEVRMYVNGLGSMSRIVLDQCIAATALPGLRSSTDVTLDEFAQYEPNLRTEVE